MKHVIVAAGALLLGTSAFAYAPDSWAEKGWSEQDKLVAEKTAHQLKGATLDVLAQADAEAQPASVATWSDDHEAKALAVADKSDAWSEGGLVNASAVTWQEPEPAVEADPNLDLAETPADEAPIDETPLDTTAGTTAETSLDTTAAPVEIAAADLTTRPADTNYPACAPGPGDDRCIQLYEPGVRVALASWNQPTGGLADGSVTTAMGGPYEPADDGSGETAMNGDGTVDAALGESEDAETAGL